MRIRVCDDDNRLAEGWVEDVKDVVPAHFDVERMNDAKEEVSKLLKRKIAVENNEPPLEIETAFDDIDVLAVDYDLVHLDKDGSRTTGEGVARLARAYSRCGTIVVMNQYKGADFDLAMRGHLDSHADLNIVAKQLGERALWDDLPPIQGAFDPTIWTPLPKLHGAARRLETVLKEAGLGATIMPLIGLQPSALGEISDSAYGFLSQSARTVDDLSRLTLREFLRRAPDEAVFDALADKAPDLLFGYAAYRLVKWLDRAVLRPLNVLIDAPHLVDRMPFLMKEEIDVTGADNWALAAANPRDGLRWQLLSEFHNPIASDILARDVFDWHRIVDDERFDDLQEAYLAAGAARFHLAEDTSRFVTSQALTRYRADFHNFGDRRAIERLPELTYGPQRRLQFG